MLRNTHPADDPNNPAFLTLEAALRDRVRAAQGLPPRPLRTTLSPAECARLQGLEPSYDLPRPAETAADRHMDDEVQTLLFPDRMEARLSSLREGAQRTLDETGINTCFVAYGFLEWYESSTSQTPFYAPLFLEPIQIERHSVRAHWRYFAKGTGEDTVSNITLGERLKRDFGLEIPSFAEGDSPETYFVRVEQLIVTQPRWRLRRHVTFGLFSFARLALWNDLAPERWPAGEGPHTSSVVAALLAGGEADPAGLVEAPECDVDLLAATVADPPTEILDADGSQLSAIITALGGRNLAVKGPPGTGKSQTIANLIACAISRGKRVLFLAEKMAALNVVKSRLQHAGLGPYVLEVHSTKAKRKEVLDSLETRRAQNRVRSPTLIASERVELTRLRQKLNWYADCLNKPYGATQKTIHEVLWAAQREPRGRLPEGLDRIVLNGVLDLTLLDLERAQGALRDFERTAEEVSRRWGLPSEHPWAWVRKALSPFETEDLTNAARQWYHEVKEVSAVAEEIATLVKARCSTTEDLGALMRMLQHLPSHVPDTVNARLLPLLFDQGLRQSLKSLVALAEGIERILGRWRGAIDLESASARPELTEALPALVEALGVGTCQVADVAAILQESEKQRHEYKCGLETAVAVGSVLRLPTLTTAQDVALVLEVVVLLHSTPPVVFRQRLQLLADEAGRSRLKRIVRRAQELREEKRKVNETFRLTERPDPQVLRSAARLLQEAGFLSRVSPSGRRARALSKNLTRNPTKSRPHKMAADLDRLGAYFEAARAFSQDRWLADLLRRPISGPDEKVESLLEAAAFTSAVDQLVQHATPLTSAIRGSLLTDSGDLNLPRFGGHLIRGEDASRSPHGEASAAEVHVGVQGGGGAAGPGWRQDDPRSIA